MKFSLSKSIYLITKGEKSCLQRFQTLSDDKVTQHKRLSVKKWYYFSFSGVQSFGHFQLVSLVLLIQNVVIFVIFTCTKIIDKTAIFIYHLKVHFMCFQMILEL